MAQIAIEFPTLVWLLYNLFAADPAMHRAIASATRCGDRALPLELEAVRTALGRLNHVLQAAAPETGLGPVPDAVAQEKLARHPLAFLDVEIASHILGRHRLTGRLLDVSAVKERLGE